MLIFLYFHSINEIFFHLFLSKKEKQLKHELFSNIYIKFEKKSHDMVVDEIKLNF
jgi:hypothetical protein